MNLKLVTTYCIDVAGLHFRRQLKVYSWVIPAELISVIAMAVQVACSVDPLASL